MTTPHANATLDTARAYADQATAITAKLKPGTYEAVQALALTSIAHSLTAIAASAHRD